MKILVKISKESTWSNQTAMSFGTDLTRKAKMALPFVLVAVPQWKVARARFVASDDYSCVLFCFDVHS